MSTVAPPPLYPHGSMRRCSGGFLEFIFRSSWEHAPIDRRGLLLLLPLPLPLLLLFVLILPSNVHHSRALFLGQILQQLDFSLQMQRAIISEFDSVKATSN